MHNLQVLRVYYNIEKKNTIEAVNMYSIRQSNCLIFVFLPIFPCMFQDALLWLQNHKSVDQQKTLFAVCPQPRHAALRLATWWEESNLRQFHGDFVSKAASIIQYPALAVPVTLSQRQGCLWRQGHSLAWYSYLVDDCGLHLEATECPIMLDIS